MSALLSLLAFSDGTKQKGLAGSPSKPEIKRRYSEARNWLDEGIRERFWGP